MLKKKLGERPKKDAKKRGIRESSGGFEVRGRRVYYQKHDRKGRINAKKKKKSK